MSDGALRANAKATEITETAVTADAVLSDAAGTHFDLDEQALRAALHVDVRAGRRRATRGVERQHHSYARGRRSRSRRGRPGRLPACWNVDYQRGDYADGSNLEPHDGWNVAWDRNWRYYLGRPVKTTLGVTGRTSATTRARRRNTSCGSRTATSGSERAARREHHRLTLLGEAAGDRSVRRSSTRSAARTR